MPNDNNEKLVGINFLRLKYWLSRRDVLVANSVQKLLGLAGYFPIHPLTFVEARHTREQLKRIEQLTSEARQKLSEGEKAVENE